MGRITPAGSLSLLTLFILASSGCAQSLNSTLVGCKDVDCPLTDGDDYTCTVEDDKFDGVGLARISGVPDAYSGISLVKAVSRTTEAQNVSFKSVFFLGTPASLDVDSLDGCAVVFYGAAGGPQFNLSSTAANSTAAAQGTCADVIAQTCLDALTDRATSVAQNTTSGSKCDALTDSLKSNAPSECADMVGTGKGLGSLNVTSLSDLSPITTAQNSSSDCWPITPKTDSLSEIAANSVTSGATYEDYEDQEFIVSPVLTLFFGNESATTNTSSQLTCLKVVSEKALDEATDGKANAAPKNSYGLLMTAATLLAVLASIVN